MLTWNKQSPGDPKMVRAYETQSKAHGECICIVECLLDTQALEIHRSRAVKIRRLFGVQHTAMKAWVVIKIAPETGPHEIGQLLSPSDRCRINSLSG